MQVALRKVSGAVHGAKLIGGAWVRVGGAEVSFLRCLGVGLAPTERVSTCREVSGGARWIPFTLRAWGSEGVREDFLKLASLEVA